MGKQRLYTGSNITSKKVKLERRIWDLGFGKKNRIVVRGKWLGASGLNWFIRFFLTQHLKLKTI